MKKKTNIRTIIRKIVREEVAMAIQEVITELKQPTRQQVSQPKLQKKIVEKKEFTTNSVLNDVLNETAMDDEWKTMGGGTYDSSKMNDVLQSSYGNMVGSNESGVVVNGVSGNEPGMDFLKKDYRAVMKAVDKKQGK
tara:strand:- start:76 stop:486 length:411 start_codon:yes stop_codon:yes gene_type:complete